MSKHFFKENDVVLLTTYAGLPNSFSFFIPDAGLAVLHQSLTQNNIKCYVADFNNIGIYKKMVRNAAIDSSFLQNSRKIDAALYFDFVEKSKYKFYEHAELLILESLRLKIREYDIAIIGAKLWLGEAFILMMNVFKRLKQEHPHLKIVVGGPSVSAIGPKIINLFNQSIDYVTFGYGEKSIITVVEAAKRERHKNIVEISHAHGIVKVVGNSDETSETKIEFPSYSYLDKEAMIGEKIGVFLIEDSRGCINRCPFCPHSKNTRKTVADVHATTQHMQYLNKTYGAQYFRLTGSSPEQNYIEQLSDDLLQQKQKFTMSCFLHPAVANKIDATKVRSAGFIGFLLGIETLEDDQHVLDKLKTTDIELGETLEKLCKSNIFTCLSLIYPQASGKTKGLLRFVKEHEHLNSCLSYDLCFPRVYPQTPWWNRSADYQIGFTDKNAYLRDIIFEDKSVSEHITIGGRNTKELGMEYKKVKAECRQLGAKFGTGDELALFGRSLNMPPSDVSKKEKYLFNAYDLEGIETFASEINREVCGVAL